jgi:hypothetical protein
VRNSKSGEHHGLEPVLQCPLPGVSTTCPVTSSWVQHNLPRDIFLGSAQTAPGHLPGVSTTCPGTSSWGQHNLPRDIFLGAQKLPGPLCHCHRVPGPSGGVQQGPATSLLPHRPYDCGIDLLPNTTLPRACLYSLSGLETKATETDIGDSLAARLIRPSSSPASTGFIFVEKKDKILRLCIEYWGLNDIRVKNRYVMNLLDLRAAPGGYHVFQAGYTECLPPGADTGGG